VQSGASGIDRVTVDCSVIVGIDPAILLINISLKSNIPAADRERRPVGRYWSAMRCH